ncbi:hypothetical protein R6Q57_025959 [Mikania cordata]
MGNCMKKQPTIQSNGDNWGSPAMSHEKMFFSGNDRKTGTTEVKIKISKKQLEELLKGSSHQHQSVGCRRVNCRL